MIYDIIMIKDAPGGICKDGEYDFSNVLSSNFPFWTDKNLEI
jgi:hypothetical protein